jgi:hypothetical protein
MQSMAMSRRTIDTTDQRHLARKTPAMSMSMTMSALAAMRRTGVHA